MKEHFLLIELRLKKFNANSGFYTIGLPAITAFAGFFHNLQRKINQQIQKTGWDGDITIHDFAILAKNIKVREGHAKYVKALKSSDKFSTPASTVDEKVADGDFAFLIRYSEDIDPSFYSDSQAEDFPHFLERMMVNTKIAGGEFNIINKNYQTNKFFTSPDFNYINKHIKHAEYFYLVDESEQLKSMSFDDYISAISRTSLKPKSKLKERPVKPFYIPIVPGYHLLEEPNHKMNSALRSNSHKHAFAEPVLSLARFQSVYSVLFHYNKASEESADTHENINENNELLPKIFWSYAYSENYYFVAAKPINTI